MSDNDPKDLIADILRARRTPPPRTYQQSQQNVHRVITKIRHTENTKTFLDFGVIHLWMALLELVTLFLGSAKTPKKTGPLKHAKK